MLQIQTIMDRAEQGVTSPFICMAENGLEYFVKGLHATRASQINEWIGGNMAQALGLPVAPFELLEVGEELYEELPAKMKEIGKGICFGSLAQKGCALLEPADIPRIDIVMQRQIATFDWFVRNEDRTIGNPNLLYRNCNNSLIVIDHNCAFDTGFNPNNFLQNHIFSSAFRQILEDWVLREEMELWLKSALPAYGKAWDNLPPEWAWANEECDLPAAYNRSHTDETVRRIDNGTLWSIS